MLASMQSSVLDYIWSLRVRCQLQFFIILNTRYKRQIFLLLLMGGKPVKISFLMSRNKVRTLPGSGILHGACHMFLLCSTGLLQLSSEHCVLSSYQAIYDIHFKHGRWIYIIVNVGLYLSGYILTFPFSFVLFTFYRGIHCWIASGPWINSRSSQGIYIS